MATTEIRLHGIWPSIILFWPRSGGSRSSAMVVPLNKARATDSKKACAVAISNAALLFDNRVGF